MTRTKERNIIYIYETLNQWCLKDYILHVSCRVYKDDKGIRSANNEETLHKSNVLPDRTVIISVRRSRWDENEMFYFIKNKTTKQNQRWSERGGEEKQHQERRKRQWVSVQRSHTQSEEKKMEKTSKRIKENNHNS